MAASEREPAPASSGDRAIKYSVVVPFFNEAATVEELHGLICSSMSRLREEFEMVFVNDGSHDGTGIVLEKIAQADGRVTVVELRRNFGQTAALQAGFDAARGEIVVAMDGDLQHDPAEIPLLVGKLDEGYDIASGWRVRRGENLLTRRLPSRAANWLLARASGVPLHDFGTTFKAYRREVLADVRLYSGMHRFVPAVCARLGARVAEVPIRSLKRSAGRSKYGMARTLPVVLDLVTLRFLTIYLTRPLHLFGLWGLLLGGGGAAILTYGLAWKIVMSIERGWQRAELFAEHAPLMLVGFLFLSVGVLLTATGLIGEMQMRTYFEGTGARTYAVRRVIRRTDR